MHLLRAACLVGAAAAFSPVMPSSDRQSSSSTSKSSSSRRELLTGGLLAAASLVVPRPAHASYALYQASYDSYNDRKATGFVPVATNDIATLKDIQKDIAKRRPGFSEKRARKGTQYCAGQMSAVSPMMENICGNIDARIGISKADQSNTMVDQFGNMNIGAFGAQAAEAKRLRDLANQGRSR